MEIKKLLFVTKFEELGFDALRSLLSLRKSALEHVVFVNVIERERIALKRGKGYRKDEEIRLREAANIRFIDWAENLFERGMEEVCILWSAIWSPKSSKPQKKKKPI